MENKEIASQEKNVYRWGGLAGILGGVFSILSIVIASVFIPGDPPTYAELVARFPAVQMIRVAENLLYMFGLVCGVLLVASLFWALRKAALAPAFFGSILVIVGLVSMIISATPHVALNRVSEVYQTFGTTPAAQETLGYIWQTVWGITDTPLYVGFLVGMLGYVFLSIAMFSSPDFGKGLRWVSVAIAVVGLAAAVMQMITPGSDIGAASFFAYLILDFVLGIKVNKISKTA